MATLLQIDLEEESGIEYLELLLPNNNTARVCLSEDKFQTEVVKWNDRNRMSL